MTPRPVSGARTPLFGALRRAFRLAAEARRTGAAPDDLVGAAHEARLDRRAFLRVAGAGVAGLTLGPTLAGCAAPARMRRDARVAIVGGGMAGLHAAYRLQQAGVRATVYEASGRTGGRMHTATGLVGPGLTTELGGEFIDSGHADLLGLVAEFGLDLYDRQTPGEAALRHAFYFGGRQVTEAEVVAAFVPLAARIQADFDSTGDVVDYLNEGGAAALDRLSIAEYLDRIGATGTIRALLDGAYVTEFGLDAGDQSALNLVFLIGTDTAGGFEPFGESDERLKVVGGNERVVEALAARVAGQIETGQRLVAARPRGAGVRLVFESGAATREVDADAVVLALPFTLLRDVDLAALDLPAFKTRAIRELGYGTNAKLFAGTAARPWRGQGYNGECFTDAAFQLCWDHTQLQPGTAGGLTLYSGGAAGVAVGEGTPESHLARLLPDVDGAFPGVLAAQNGRTGRFHWPSHPFTRGSYACYRPGQWTTVAGAEIVPVGNVFFAGEHCSADFQGYMNGAAETGRRAAASVLAALGVAAS